MAGEVVAVGADVKKWKQGDRVCSNFSTDHLDGDTDEEIIKTSLGGQCQGVLTQYKNLPAHVCLCIFSASSCTDPVLGPRPHPGASYLRAGFDPSVSTLNNLGIQASANAYLVALP